MNHCLTLMILSFLIFSPLSLAVNQSGVQIRDFARFDGVRNNALTGYGLVVGLSGTGDSNRSRSTVQSIRNTLQNFGVVVDDKDIFSKNVAAVLITSELSAFAQQGDVIDVQVSAMGDARSLMGGTLLLAPLKAVNGSIYALAQGPLAVGGYQLDKFDSAIQKNHPTVGTVLGGGTVERSINNDFLADDGSLYLVLNSQNFATAAKVEAALNRSLSNIEATAIHASRIKIKPLDEDVSIVQLMAKIETIQVRPDTASRVVVNEKTGVIVSGADVMIDDVVISYGALKLSVSTDYLVSQPNSFLYRPSDAIRTQVVPETRLSDNTENQVVYSNEQGTNIADFVTSLQKLNLSTRDIISILQALKKSGGLHAELIIQ
ncbi:flagellar basal body P-ring protein FlgI [Catenovulum sp. SM1970]|uniref:flagellar basal body P-ring protein FlgI n=1 Tax=Marinifaba aquimaris TaxID=2741323 RepID=UPI0015733014|nr:flagellar basal body P-ring protein FlgI [Marinifaba aquimaris]NTS77390.1 flagellar basal body P-ring protein FlgI [Marinifaba aquimaris]